MILLGALHPALKILTEVVLEKSVLTCRVLGLAVRKNTAKTRGFGQKEGFGTVWTNV